MQVCRVPLIERVAFIGRQDSGMIVTPLCVDGIGVCVYHLQNADLSPDRIRGSRPFLRPNFTYVEADNEVEARAVFLQENPEAFLGGEREETRALRIDPNEPIVIFPPCERLHRSDIWGFVCGEPQEDDEDELGKFGGCVLIGCDPPENYPCPIAEFGNLSFNLTRPMPREDWEELTRGSEEEVSP